MQRELVEKLCELAQLADLIRQRAKNRLSGPDHLTDTDAEEIIIGLAQILDTAPIRLLQGQVDIIMGNPTPPLLEPKN